VLVASLLDVNLRDHLRSDDFNLTTSKPCYFEGGPWELRLTRKLLKQGLLVVKLKSSLRRWSLRVTSNKEDTETRFTSDYVEVITSKVVPESYV
jgi:hypothetical protein